MSTMSTDAIWFVTRDDDDYYRYWEQELRLEDGVVVAIDEAWWDDEASMPLGGETLAARVAQGIDSSLDDGRWLGNVIAAGWCFGREPEWHRERRLAVAP